MAARRDEPDDMEVDGARGGPSGSNVRQAAYLSGPRYDFPGSDDMDDDAGPVPGKNPAGERSGAGPAEGSVTPYDDMSLIRDLRWAAVDEVEASGLFNSDVMEHLRDMPKLVYDHQEVGYHIRSFIEQSVAEDSDGSFYPVNKEELKKDLVYLAYKDDVAEKIVKQIPESILPTRHSAFWALCVLENFIMRGHKGLYQHSLGCIDMGLNGPLIKGSNETFKLKNYSSSSQARDDEFTNFSSFHFFHGSDWDSIDNMATRGVVLGSESSFGHDFSYMYRPGFYLCNNFKQAIFWAESTNACPAVIVFRVPKNCFRDRERHLNLSDRDEEFRRRVYKYNRSGGKQEVEVEAETDRFLSITGPMLLNPVALENDDRPLEVSDEKYTCILDKNLASQFKSYVHSIHYFKKRELTLKDEG